GAGAGVERGVVGRDAGAAGLDAVVDLAVAVVVQAVAQLRARGHVAHAVEHAAGAVEHAGLALAGVAAADLALLRDVAVVDLGVAVVVDAVAHLGERRGAALALPGAARAGEG